MTLGAVSAQPVVIAALGDSLTAGYGLAPDQGLVPQLQRWLDAAGAEARVLNAGVSGDTTTGAAARVAWTLTPEVQAMIVTLGGNDMLRGIDPSVARASLDAILAEGKAAGVAILLVGMTAPGNYGPDYKAEFDRIYPELATLHGVLFHPSLLAPLAEAAQGGAALGRYMQADAIHPNAEGVALVVQALGPKVLELIGAVKAR